MTKHRLASVSAAVLALVIAGTAPAFAQGAFQSPPSPNAANSMPQAVDSAPPGARTLPPGTTGTQRTGTLATTQVLPATRHPRTRHVPPR